MVVYEQFNKPNKKVWCESCGEQGHKFYECPEKLLGLGNGGSIYCSICGLNNHPTYDCPQNSKFQIFVIFLLEKRNKHQEKEEITMEEELHNFLKDMEKQREQKDKMKSITGGSEIKALTYE